MKLPLQQAHRGARRRGKPGGEPLEKGDCAISVSKIQDAEQRRELLARNMALRNWPNPVAHGRAVRRRGETAKRMPAVKARPWGTRWRSSRRECVPSSCQASPTNRGSIPRTLTDAGNHWRSASQGSEHVPAFRRRLRELRGLIGRPRRWSWTWCHRPARKSGASRSRSPNAQKPMQVACLATRSRPTYHRR